MSARCINDRIVGINNEKIYNISLLGSEIKLISGLIVRFIEEDDSLDNEDIIGIIQQVFRVLAKCKESEVVIKSQAGKLTIKPDGSVFRQSNFSSEEKLLTKVPIVDREEDE